MSLLFPHSVLRRLADENVADRIVNGVSYGIGEAFNVHLFPVTQEAGFQRWGVELTRPHGLIWEASDPERFPVGCMVEDQMGRVFIVKSPTEAHMFGNAADNCSCAMEQIEVVPESVPSGHLDDPLSPTGRARVSPNTAGVEIA